MKEEVDARVFTIVAKSLCKNMNDEQDFSRVIEESANELKLTKSNLEGYLIYITLNAFKEILED